MERVLLDMEIDFISWNFNLIYDFKRLVWNENAIWKKNPEIQIGFFDH